MELAQEKEEEARRLRERYMQRMEEQTSRENIVLSRVPSSAACSQATANITLCTDCGVA